jgi:GR25 family glycosyltransferase involved in LPS biosynthesis
MKMYVINLDSRPDRFFNVSQQFSSRGLDLIRISAVSGQDLAESVEKTIAPPNNQAVWMSHQKVYRELLNSEDQYCVVFEDDVVMTDGAFCLLQEFERASERLSDLDYLQFGYLTYSGKLGAGEFDLRIRILQRVRSFAYCRMGLLIRLLQMNEKNFSFFSKILKSTRFTHKRINRFIYMRNTAKELKLKAPLIYSNESGGHAYIIHRTFAAALLKFNLPLFLVTDLGTFCLAKASNFNMYRTSKSLAFQDNSAVSTGLHSSKVFDIGHSL